MKFGEVIAKRDNKTVYRNGDKTIKVFDTSCSKEEILMLAHNTASVEETGLKIPKLLEVRKEGENWIIVTEYIEGTTLSSLMEKNPEKMDEYLDKFVDLQMLIHSKRAHGLLKLKDKMLMKIAMTDLDDTVKYDLQTRLESMPKHVKVCHGDFNPSNVIVTDDGEMYVLDWTHTTIGNASADVARTYLMFCLAEKTEIAEKYLDKFCEKSKTDKRYVQKFLPIVAASQSVKQKEKEREFLLRWVNVVEYQ